MLGHAIAHTILLGEAGSWAVCCALLVFSGLLGPLKPKARALREIRRAVRSSDEPPPKAREDWSVREDRPEASAMTLNAIELALIAELNLERARDHDAVANDAARLPKVRQAAPAPGLELEQAGPLTPGRRGRRRGLPDLGQPSGVVRHRIVVACPLEIQLRDQRQLDRVEAYRQGLGLLFPGLGRRPVAGPDRSPEFPGSTCLRLQWAQEPGEDQERAVHRQRAACAQEGRLR